MNVWGAAIRNLNNNAGIRVGRFLAAPYIIASVRAQTES